MRLFIACIAVSLGVTLFAQEAAFTPQVAAPKRNPVALEINPRHGLMTLQAELNGKPCTLLFDTGASHTTFDRDFIEKTLPETKLFPIAVGGDTNVREQPAAFRITSLKLGEADLMNFFGMTLPLGHLSEQMGLQIDGILGINAMGYAPFVLEAKMSRVTWLAPGKVRLIKPTTVPVVQESDKLTIRLLGKTSPEGETFPILLDSGSSYSFFTADQWQPAADEQSIAMKTGDVNATASHNFTRGAEASLYLGDTPLTFAPYISQTSEAVLGADALKKLTLYVDAKHKRVAILRPKIYPAQGARP